MSRSRSPADLPQAPRITRSRTFSAPPARSQELAKSSTFPRNAPIVEDERGLRSRGSSLSRSGVSTPSFSGPLSRRATNPISRMPSSGAPPAESDYAASDWDAASRFECGDGEDYMEDVDDMYDVSLHGEKFSPGRIPAHHADWMPPVDGLTEEQKKMAMQGKLVYRDLRGSEEGAKAKRRFVVAAGVCIPVWLGIGAYSLAYGGITAARGSAVAFSAMPLGVFTVAYVPLAVMSILAMKRWDSTRVDSVLRTWAIRPFYRSYIPWTILLLANSLAVGISQAKSEGSGIWSIDASRTSFQLFIATLVVAGLFVPAGHVVHGLWEKAVHWNTDSWEAVDDVLVEEAIKVEWDAQAAPSRKNTGELE